MDQIVVQRCLASRTLASAQRTVLTGSVLLVAAYTVELLMALSLVLWFRGCDSQLSGAIKNTDQVLPFYIKTHLMQFPGFTGLFLAAVVSAGASTISSSINSMIALLHVDVLPYFFKSAGSDVPFRTQGLAFLLGAVMTIYSCICVYVGSVTRAMILVYSAAAGPCIGLLLLAIGLPFVHSKGAGISTLLFFAIQLYLLWQRIEKIILPQRMPVTLQYCPRNTTDVHKRLNDTHTWSPHRSVNHDAPYLISPFWSSLFSTAGTLLLGILISIATGEYKQLPADFRYLNPSLAKMWLKLHVIRGSEAEEAQPENQQETTNAALVSNEEKMRCASTNV
ncbi:sodium-coupled monocarboxylate transporter 1-like isoform X2 [Dermacentor albipictus]|uniref:sodium-coupled monocarboxylate transporter 1-like isoform X2 n=1 Tax=Dermacentor albipictus TaxID=60249 RepID=UPI0038FC7742